MTNQLSRPLLIHQNNKAARGVIKTPLHYPNNPITTSTSLSPNDICKLLKPLIYATNLNHLHGWKPTVATAERLGDCSHCPLKDLRGSTGRRGTTNPTQHSSYCPIDPAGSPWAPSTALRDTPKVMCCLRSRTTKAYCMQTAFSSAGQFGLAPHTRKWLHSD